MGISGNARKPLQAKEVIGKVLIGKELLGNITGGEPSGGGRKRARATIEPPKIG
jgi:hypothetical protein